MRTSLNLSLSQETYKQVEDMKDLKIIPSHFFKKAMKAYADNNFKLPITIKDSEAVI